MPRTVLRVALAILLSGVVLEVVPDSAALADVPAFRGGVNQRIGGKAPLLRTAEASGLAVNPADSRHVVEAEVNPRYGLCQYNVSFDAGETWTTGVLKAPNRFGPMPCELFNNVNRLRMDGGIAFGSGQNVYIAFDVRPPDLSEGSTTLVARSTDGGRTFAEAQVVMAGTPGIDPGFGNQPGQQSSYLRPKLAVQRRPGGDRVIVASNGLNFNVRSVAVAVSNDSGATWGAPVRAEPAGEFAQYLSQPVVGPDGTIYVAWRTQHTEAFGYSATADEFNWISRSADGGVTWSSTVVRKLAVPNKTSRVNERRLAIDSRDGTLYYVDNETRTANNPDILLTRSSDQGFTWSEPVRVHDEPTPAVQQSIPNVSVAPGGRVDVVWSDRRNAYGGPANYHDIYMASSSDGGRTFSPSRRLTDRSISLSNGLTTVRGNDFFVPGIVPLGDSEVLVSWSDARLTDFETENMDIFSAKVRINPSDPPPSTQLPIAQPGGLSASLSRLAYPGGAEKHVANAVVPGSIVVIVNDADAGLATAASVLARANLGPVIAAPSFGLPPDAAAEVKRIKPIAAYLVGNDAALSSTVVGDLVRSGVPADKVFRLAGANPPDTARLVADTYKRLEAANARTAPTTAVIVDPASPEAGAAASMAAFLRLPVLFAERDGIPAATTAALSALGTTSTVVIGGPQVISDAAIAALPGATRLGGPDVYATSRAIVAYGAARGIPGNVAYVADGARPIDAALLGAAVARLGGTVVLTPLADPALAGGSPDRVVVARSVNEGPLGYRLVSSDGGVFAFGGARFLGSTAAIRLVAPIVGTASTLGAGGYWLVAGDGGIFAFGDARFFGSAGAIKLNKPIVGMARTPTGLGYWLVASDGGVFAFGDAPFKGSTGAMKLNQAIVGIAASPTGNGYYLVAADGGVFAFGDAEFRGSTGALKLNKPVVSMATTPSGRGYLLAASDGGVFAFGDAQFRGSAGAIVLQKPIIGMSPTPAADGYWLTASDGGVFAFGAAPFLGSAAGLTLNAPVTAAGR